VSGGSSGIGRAVAEAFAARGWPVALGARGAARLAEAAEAASARGRALGVPVDVADADAVAHFYDEAERALGPVDVLVACAAHARPGALDRLSAREVREEVESGLVGSLLFAREGIRRLRQRDAPGDVVLVSSSSAAVPWPLHVAYAASKAGVEQAARSLALELEGTGVRVTVVRVGNTIGTGWAADWSPEELGAVAEWQRHGLLRHGGLLVPERVAEAILWVVGLPRAVQLDLVSVQPEAPLADPERSSTRDP
jgi:NAD(P)-dependent dehydrogenase (short-subunit alcohol dehydrogenase family)